MQIQKINITFRFVFIAILVIVCFSASSFMVLESSEFFERFYLAEDSKNFGFISSFLNEVFLVIMASVWVPAIRKGDIKKFHPANLLIKGLVILLFINTVGGASLNTVQKKLTNIQEQKNRIAVLSILKSQIEDQQENISTFKGQNQKVNTVIATRKLNEIKEELKKLQASKQSATALWIDVLFITMIRFTIQLANITAVWLASWLYRTMPNLGQTLKIESLSQTPPSKVVVSKDLLFEPQKNLKSTSNKSNTNSSHLREKKKKDTIVSNKPIEQKMKFVKKTSSSAKKNYELANHNCLEENKVEKTQIINQIKDSLSDLSNAEGVSSALGIPLAKLIKLKQGESTEFDLAEIIHLKEKINVLKEQSL